MSSGFDLDALIEQLEDIYEVLFLGSNIASLSISGIMMLVGLIGVLLGAILSVAIYVLEALPIYRVAKKLGRSKAWLAWIPFFGSVFRLYVLCDAAGDKPVSFFGKVCFKSRTTSFLVYLAIVYFGTALLTVAISILSIIPIIGYLISMLGSILYLIPVVACAFFEYAYLKDVLDLFKADKKSNNTAAIVITVLDSLVTGGIARLIWLYTLWGKTPLPEEEKVPFCQPENEVQSV